MKALTLWQPHAALVAARIKRFETRKWRTEHRGQLAIHAADRTPREARELCKLPAFRYALRNVPAPLVHGCIIAVVDLAEVVRTEDLLGQLDMFEQGQLAAVAMPLPDDFYQQLHFGNFGPNRFAWRLGNVRALKEPIAVTGARMLWEWDAPADLEERLAA
jgi:hypothetical protein